MVASGTHPLAFEATVRLRTRETKRGCIRGSHAFSHTVVTNYMTLLGGVCDFQKLRSTLDSTANKSELSLSRNA
jgi:hypothetical protein